MNKEKMVWIDLETSGLDPEDCFILEVACIVTDNDLKPLGGMQAVIQRSQGQIDGMNEWCRVQHTESGLAKVCVESTRILFDVEVEIVKLLETLEAVNAPLCGSSAHFDRGFIKQRMPKLFEKLHYRNFDVSTVKQVWERWLPHVNMQIPEKRELHRGLPDLEDSIALARVYRESLIRMQGWGE